MSESAFLFMQKELPELYVLASKAERNLERSPAMTMSLMKQAGAWLVARIIANEEVSPERPEAFAELEALIGSEIVPEYMAAVLKQLALYHPDESEMFLDKGQVTRLFYNIYDIICWYFKTYADDRFTPLPLTLPPQPTALQSRTAPDEPSYERAASTIRIDNQTVEGTWEELPADAQDVKADNRGRYRGQMADGMKAGEGVYRWADGTEYTGRWSRDAEYGFGVKTYANGDRYSGEWKEGMFHGRGIYEWKSGAKFEGNWADGREHGFGIKTSADGTVQTGFWTYGELLFTGGRLAERDRSITDG